MILVYIYETDHLNLLLESLNYTRKKEHIGFYVQGKFIMIVTVVHLPVQEIILSYHKTKWTLFIFGIQNTKSYK